MTRDLLGLAAMMAGGALFAGAIVVALALLGRPL
jgi:hypothetical protein